MQVTKELSGVETVESEQLILPNDLDACHMLIAAMKELLLEKDSLLEAQESDLARLKQHLQNLLRQKYGRSSEKIDPDQLLIFA